MNTTLHAQEIVDIIESQKGKNRRIKAANLCLNAFWNSVSEGFSVQKEKFEAPDAFYKQLEESIRNMITAADTGDKIEFQKQITSLRFLLNIPNPKNEKVNEEAP